MPQKEKPDLQGKNALVYDPNAISLKAAQSYLNAWQATVRAVKSREEFFTELDKLKPEIAICCDDIKETGHHPEFFICTADSSVAPAWTETISKPVTANKLKRVLLGKPAQRSASDKQQDSADLDQKQPYRLLLVEDNFINTEVALGILEDHGFDDVAHAENGQEAIECLRQGKYDLVLMDCQMPIVDGYEATKQIREGAAGSQSDIPVIAMTANAMAGDREKCLAFGMNDYISKPIDPDKLAGTIQQWL